MNSAEKYMQATTKLHALSNTMLNGVRPETVELARELVGISKELFDVIDAENRATLQSEQFRSAQSELRQARQMVGAFDPLF